MPVISDKLQDGSKFGVGAEIAFWVRDSRDSVGHDSILGPVKVVALVADPDGLFTTPVLDPGPYIVGIRWSHTQNFEEYQIEVPDESGTFRLWPLIDAGQPTPEPNAPGFVRNAGGIARVERLTIAEFAALPVKDPATLYITFES